jgi:pyridoxamine 5'-phosphate oxidase family protein
MVKPILSERETEYLKSQRLARIATPAVTTSKQEKGGGSVQPDVVPVGFDFDGNYLYVGGLNLLISPFSRVYTGVFFSLSFFDSITLAC